MASGFRDFLKNNLQFARSGLGAPVDALLGAKAIADINASDNKFKALLKTLKDFVLIRVAMVGTLTAMGRAMRDLVRDTGALDAAFRKMASAQSFARSFAPFVGGLQAARQRVSELLTLSQRGPFKFAELADANRKLEVFTRGTYSSIKATQTLGGVAIATDTNIGDVASAVGQFYDNLREGRPIDGATESLRQMGAITGSTAQRLDNMVASGATLSSVFGELTANLEGFSRAGLKGAGSQLELIQSTHEKAIENAKAAFGAGFTGSELRSTSNYTKSITAITPALGDSGGIFAKMFGGFSNAQSAIAKFAGQSGIAGAAIKLLTGLVIALGAALTTVGIIAAGELVVGIAAAITSLNALAATAAVLVGATGIGAIVLGITSLIFVMKALSTTSGTLRKELHDQAASHRESQAAIDAQVASIITLNDKNEALAATTKRLADLEKERTKLAEDRSKHEKESQARRNAGLFSRIDEQQSHFDNKREKDLDAATARARASLARASAAPFVTNESAALAQSRAEAQLGLEAGSFEAQLANASPERRIELLQQQREFVSGRLGRATIGQESAASVSSKREEFTSALFEAKAALDANQAQFDDLKDKGKKIPRALRDKIREGREEVAKLEAGQLAEGLNAPSDSATFLNTKVQQMLEAKKADAEDAVAANLAESGKGKLAARHSRNANEARIKSGGVAFDSQALEDLQVRAAMASTLESQAGSFGAQVLSLDSQREAAERELRLTMLRAETEKEITSLKSEGADRARDEYTIKMRQIDAELGILRQQGTPDRAAITALEAQRAGLQRQETLRQRSLREEREDIELSVGAHAARRAGQTGRAVALEDLETFARHFESLQEKFGPQEAARLAMEQTKDDIAQGLRPGGLRAVADSLQRIGGGGGVYAPGGDPMIQLARRQVTLQQEAVSWLNKIYSGRGGVY